jgi:hypothetical protein
MGGASMLGPAGVLGSSGVGGTNFRSLTPMANNRMGMFSIPMLAVRPSMLQHQIS